MAGIVWLVVGVALAALELLSMAFVLIMLAAGALAAALAAALGAPGWLQGLVFVVVSGLALVAIRPLIVRHRKAGSALPLAVAEMHGAIAVVTEDVHREGGRIKVKGEIWTARPADGVSRFAVGEQVVVADINGATALIGREGQA